jgi:hypothetical protein
MQEVCGRGIKRAGLSMDSLSANCSLMMKIRMKNVNYVSIIYNYSTILPLRALMFLPFVNPSSVSLNYKHIALRFLLPDSFVQHSIDKKKKISSVHPYLKGSLH